MRLRRSAVLGLAGYVAVVRPWMVRWGSTPDERTSPLPGDEVIPDASLCVTRAVDVDAPPGAVWPWLVQIGFGAGRAGFYSYDALENLAGLDVHSASRIIPELQSVAVGDRVPLGPETHFVVERADRDEAFVLHATMHPFNGRSIDREGAAGPMLDWTWAFVLRSRPGGSRLLVRTRGAWRPWFLAPLVQPAIEPVWFVMERRMLLGIRDRATSGAA